MNFQYERLQKIKLFLLDLDGTVYLSDRLIPGAKETIERLRDCGAKICFLTNNSSKTQAEYLKKLNGLGLNTVKEEIFTSAMSAAGFLRERFKDQKVYCAATEAVKSEFRENGVNVTEDDAAVVVIAYDTELTYEKLKRVCLMIARGATYVVTHADAVCPSREGDLPDVGSIIALIEKTTGRKPDYNCGKPESILGAEIAKRFGLPPQNIAMIGDRLYTDIRFGVCNGFTSVLVLSGETTTQMHEKSCDRADIVLDAIGDIFKTL